MLNAVFAFKREVHTNKDFSLKDTLVGVIYEGLKKFLKTILCF
jgi:hypothetical protein